MKERGNSKRRGSLNDGKPTKMQSSIVAEKLKLFSKNEIRPEESVRKSEDKKEEEDEDDQNSD